MTQILVLLFTGFGIHGHHQALPFDMQVKIHVFAAIGLVLLWVFAIFWRLTTTGHSFREHVSPMITGYDEVDLSEAEEAYLRQDEPGRIRD